MNSKTAFKTLRNYFDEDRQKKFVIPNYQRGYKWAIRDKVTSLSAIENLVNNLIVAYNSKANYFLQGVTVVETTEEIILIDGQQRTTSLYLLFYCLDKAIIRPIDLYYEVRAESKEFIKNLKNTDFSPLEIEPSTQDIYNFQQAIIQVQTLVSAVDNKEEFLNYLLDQVSLLYIIIDKDKATKTFTMMNGSKASMLQEELIKSEFLRCISLPREKEMSVLTTIDAQMDALKEAFAYDWEVNALRSRYAREWDKWLYWWNKEDVKSYFDTYVTLGLLLPYYFKYHTDNSGLQDKQVVFSNFKLLISSNLYLLPKEIFKKLRDLQKTFEDLYSNPIIYNTLKLSLLCSTGTQDKLDVCNYFIKNKRNISLLQQYSKYRLVGATHKEIIEVDAKATDVLRNKAIEQYKNLSSKFVYSNHYDGALKQLLRLNVEEDNKLFGGKGRKFDFSIYGSKSLEHIHPKSKVYHKRTNEETGDAYYCDGNGNDLVIDISTIDNRYISRDDMRECTEHSIGNLLLLDKNENSKFNDITFELKKDIYFNVNEVFKSRNLLHTIAVFAKSSWGVNEIANNQTLFLDRFKIDYDLCDIVK